MNVVLELNLRKRSDEYNHIKMQTLEYIYAHFTLYIYYNIAHLNKLRY